jgi:FeS assembly SUF system regulator
MPQSGAERQRASAQAIGIGFMRSIAVVRLKQYHFSTLYPTHTGSGRFDPPCIADPEPPTPLEAAMLRVTRLTDYATLILTVLASRPDRVHSAADLAERARLEAPTVSKVLKPLAHAGLVEGFRGVNGGYRLARAPEAISLVEIVEAIEGPLGMTECSVHAGQCGIEEHCGVRANWRRINDVVADALRGVSLAQMLQPPPPPPGAAREERTIPLRLAAV